MHGCTNTYTHIHIGVKMQTSWQKTTNTHNAVLMICSCHTHTQINWRISESVTHTRRLKPCLYMHNTDVHLNISRILFHSNFTTSFWARILCLKYFGSKIRPYNEETNDSDRSVPEKGLLMWNSVFKMSLQPPWEGLSYVHKQNLSPQMNI